MEKLELTKDIGECQEVDTDNYIKDKPFDIKKMISFLVEAEMNGATHIKFSGETDFDNHNNLETLWIQPVEVKLESDEAFQKRIEEEKKKEEKEKNEIKEKELEELKRLQEKYKDQ